MDQDAAANAASMKSQSVTVKVPASTSNLGSGFDTLGLAFQLYNFVRVQRSTTKGVRLLSPIPEEERAHAVIMLTEAATLFSTSPVTFMRHLLASVFTSNSSPIVTFLEALA